MNQIEFRQTDYASFRKWIDLNLDSVTWQGKYEKEFEEFWQLFFSDGLTLSDLDERFEFSFQWIKTGPLTKWFSWLRAKFICYVFIYYPLDIYTLASQTSLSEQELAFELRNFFTDKFPHLDEELNELFQVSNMASESLYLRYDDVSSRLHISSSFKGSHEDEIMNSLEVTLYEEWGTFFRKMKKELMNKRLNLRSLREKASISHQFNFVRDLMVLFVCGALLIWGLKYVNEVYEDYFSEKISIFQPDFLWLDKSLSFKGASQYALNDLDVELKDIDKLEKSEVEEIEQLDFDESEGPESEAILTSLESLPKGFSGVGFEHSEYEEAKRISYRDSLAGRRLAYRVMLKSPDPSESKRALDEMLKKYGISQVDRVKPGTEVPGGVYYNLYVPTENLSHFLSSVTDREDSILYQSRTKGRTPPGVNKVFIWIKKI